MEKLLSMLEKSKELSDIVSAMNEGAREQFVYGMTGSQKTYVMSALFQQTDRPMFVITGDQIQAEKIQKDLNFFLPDQICEVFPAQDVLSFDIYSQSREILAKRLSILNRIVRGENIIVVAPVKALLKRLVSPEDYYGSFFQIHSEKEYDLEVLIKKLVLLGYERVTMVERSGQFSIRGGILDIFVEDHELPVRIEFFGDAVDSIRLFDPLSQRSSASINSVEVSAAEELITTSDSRKAGILKIERSMNSQLKRLKEISQKNKLREKFGRIIERLADSNLTENDSVLTPFLTEETFTILSYLNKDTILMVDEPNRLQEAISSWETLLKDSFTSALESSTVLPEQLDTYLNWEKLIAHMRNFNLLLWSSLLRQTAPFRPDGLHSVTARPLYPYMGSVETLMNEIRALKKNQYQVIVMAHTNERAEKLQTILSNNGLPSSIQLKFKELPDKSTSTILVGSIESGFEFPLLKLAVMVDDEIVGKRKQKRPKHKRSDFQLFSWKDLKENEYVVHVNHGIGKFAGVSALEIEGAKKDYLLIQYQGEDKVYVPVDQMDLVQRYVGPDQHKPKISRLGGSDWQKAKLNAKAAVAEMADQLLELYAERESVTGYMFSPDMVWQKEFEDKFEYQETEDQLKAVEDAKQDMQKAKPMDRLLCGDVGYGKTEVAIRAAFKAAMEGKQVGVLVPTTVLAQQHFNTFHARFQGYPVKIEMMSRFVSDGKHKEIIKGLKAGLVDIVIGTHRILQKDVAFRDLGLLVIDEEQRFGVRHKERMKEMKSNVDVLTLTATPIPRTLHMALSGIRDMSMIMEPPEDRRPVQTYVLEEHEALIRDVILREINRGGQVYYIHNKVKTIDRTARKLQRIVPEAAVVVGHGQMKEEDLERTMIDFIEKEFDILVCTTIVETGMDIPNVNTIIVEDADHFGLSQLYQLRGRVGRSSRQGYCYLLFKRNKVLTEIAEKRLEAIKEFTEFGSGFKIAMKDLEIRGAGNLLGAEQHGHLASVGFELYCRLLEEAVNVAKGQVIAQPPDPLIDIKINAHLSGDYISDSQQKIEIYKKVASSQSEEEIRDIIDEMVDRFGDLPTEAQQLLDIIRIKILAREVFIDSINHIKDCINIRFSSLGSFDQQEVANGMKKHFEKLSMVAAEKPRLTLNVQGMSQKEILKTLKEILSTLKYCIKV